MDKIRVRDDDVLLRSRGFAGQEFDRFKGYHNTVLQDQKHFIHVGAILVTEIQEFPNAIAFLRDETAAGRFLPEVHGLKHIDYANLKPSEIVEHLIQCREFIQENFNYNPTVFYTPWGAGADERGKHIGPSAEAAGYRMVTTEGRVENHIHRMEEDIKKIQAGTFTNEELLQKWAGRETLLHWWESVGSLDRVVKYFSKL
jgi:hypothetical protein